MFLHCAFIAPFNNDQFYSLKLIELCYSLIMDERAIQYNFLNSYKRGPNMLHVNLIGHPCTLHKSKLHIYTLVFLSNKH